MKTWLAHLRDAPKPASIFEQWDDWPVEARLAMTVLPLGTLLATQMLATLPVFDDVFTPQEFWAAGSIMALLEVFMVQITFGRHAKEKAKSAATGPRVSQPEPDLAGILCGTGPARHVGRLQTRMDVLRLHDPGFSEPLFLAYCQRLAIEILSRRDRRETLAPYIAPAVWTNADTLMGGVERMLPGPARIIECVEARVWTTVVVQMPLLVVQGASLRLANLTWHLRRSEAARSAVPADLFSFGCPACGAEPVSLTHPDGTCAMCNTAIGHGQLCWQLVDLVATDADAPLRPPGRPDPGGAHPSIEPETVEHINLPTALRALKGRHPEFSPKDVAERAVEALTAWIHAQATGDVSGLTGLVTEDRLVASRHQVGLRKAARWTLSSGAPTIDQVEWIRVARDGWHELVELRV